MEIRKCVNCERKYIALWIDDSCPYCAIGDKNGAIIAILKHRVSLIEQAYGDQLMPGLQYGKLVGYLEAIDLLERQSKRDVPFTGDPMVDSTGGCI